MKEPTILVVKPKSISPDDKGKLRKSGILVIEMENPSDFKFIKCGIEMDSFGLVRCAIQALSSQPQESGDKLTTASLQRQKFVQLMSELLLEGKV